MLPTRTKLPWTPAPWAPMASQAMVACPDSRPPAYQAVIGLAKQGLLADFRTAAYYDGDGSRLELGRQIAPEWTARIESKLWRRHDPEIPADRVRPSAWVDAAQAVENRLGPQTARRAVAQWRTRHFDRTVARALAEERPGSLFVFSDVGSEFALPACRRLGIRSVLSMVHGDVRQEQSLLRLEAERSPEFFPIYLGEGGADPEMLAWLHDRRLRELELADHVLVPSEHIAQTLIGHGLAPSKLTVVPYAADVRRFRPDPAKLPASGSRCTFLFAGGISQRKGIKYLLEAWRQIRRPGWKLQLLGAMPAHAEPLEPYRAEVEWLGRVAHSEMPARMAAADVFVFPSLFEGSAVVTYEALACGLPCVVTPEAGSVVRDGHEGLVVPSADVERLAQAMERLGTDAALRQQMATAARQRAEAYDWSRYHAAIVQAVRGALRTAVA